MKIENEYGTIEILEKINAKNATFLCHCGKIKTNGNYYKLKTGEHKSCGCTLPKFIDYTGKKIGNMTVIGREKRKNGPWKCICECGNEKFVEASVLKRGGFKDCKCPNKNRLYKNKIYKAWLDYKIKNKLSEEFYSFDVFNNHIKSLNPPKENFKIARINKNKKYSKENIKLQINSHISKINNIDHKFCVKCQRYFEHAPVYFIKRGNTCNECRLKTKLKNKFNLTYSEYLNIININQSKCGICKKELNFDGNRKTGCVDHCHKTGKVRGILCKRCNSGIGVFKENTSYMQKSIIYLKRGDTEYQYLKNNPIIDTICPITGETENLVCDHNHNTGYIRGNIYNYINLALGLMNDSSENLESAINYLEKGKSNE